MDEAGWNVEHLIPVYTGLADDIGLAEVVFAIGGGVTICASEVDRNHLDYYFIEASGDSPSGCINKIYHHFRSDTDGVVSPIGSWDRADSSEPPIWSEAARTSHL